MLILLVVVHDDATQSFYPYFHPFWTFFRLRAGFLVFVPDGYICPWKRSFKEAFPTGLSPLVIRSWLLGAWGNSLVGATKSSYFAPTLHETRFICSPQYEKALCHKMFWWVAGEVRACSSFRIQKKDLTVFINALQILTKKKTVGFGCSIRRLHLYRGIKPLPMSVLDMTLNNLMVKLQSRRFGEEGVPLHCHCSQVHSDPEW